jgi:hypothetical protein
MRGSGGSRMSTENRAVAEYYPRCQIEIIWELAIWPILPILQTMAGALNALFSALRDHSPPWVWTIDLAFYEGHDPAHGFEATREAAREDIIASLAVATYIVTDFKLIALAFE